MKKSKKTNRSEKELIDFYIGGEVSALIHDLKRKREQNKDDPDWIWYSDIVDAQGHQYLDLVQEGGGVLGISLLGYTYVLEEFGFRFLSLGGTSAGAINTVLLAAAGKPHEKKTIKLLKILATKNLFDFVDTPDRMMRSLFKNILGEKIKRWKLIYQLPMAIDNVISLRNTKGFNPGNAFESWLKSILADFKVESMQKLRENMQPELPLFHRIDEKTQLSLEGQIKPDLALVATDLTTQTKSVFPRMSDLYFKDPDAVNPSAIVRASMSIPIIFEPYRLSSIPNHAGQNDKWIEKANWDGHIPKEVLFVDGGVVSNFPFDSFHRTGKVPRMPTFGVKLGIDRTALFETNGLLPMLMHTFEAARQMSDFNFQQKNREEYDHLVKNIDTAGYNWVDFNISEKKKRELFVKGARAAAQFITGFHWTTYKKLRERQIAQPRG